MLLEVPEVTHERSHGRVLQACHYSPIIHVDKTAAEAQVFLLLGKFKRSNSLC